MKKRKPGAPPNLAARALREGQFRQRIVKKRDAYSRKVKHPKRDVQSNEHPFFISVNAMDRPNLSNELF